MVKRQIGFGMEKGLDLMGVGVCVYVFKLLKQ